MNARAAAVRRARWRRFLAWPITVALSGAATTARSELWSLENSLESRHETNDNIALSSTSAGTVNSLYLSESLVASRRSESMATRLNATLTSVRQQGNAAQNRTDGQFLLAQSLSELRDTVDASVSYAQDFNSTVQNADVTVGPGRRKVAALAGSWSHLLSERLGTSLQVNATKVDYGAEPSGANPYRNVSLSISASYQLSEIDAASVQASRSDYRPQFGASSVTDSVGIGLSRALSERSSASVNIGSYRTTSLLRASRRTCPLAVSFCDSGLVAFGLSEEELRSTGRGLQYSASLLYQFSERTSLSLIAGRQVQPSGAATVVRSDTLNIGANHAFSETLAGSASYARSSATATQLVPLTGITEQQSLAVSVSKRITEDLSLSAVYQRNQAGARSTGSTAHSNSVGISLKYNWPRFEASR